MWLKIGLPTRRWVLSFDALGEDLLVEPVSPISENQGVRIGSTDAHRHQSGPSRFSPSAMQSK
jgi:hypothetical protein